MVASTLFSKIANFSGEETWYIGDNWFSSAETSWQAAENYKSFTFANANGSEGFLIMFKRPNGDSVGIRANAQGVQMVVRTSDGVWSSKMVMSATGLIGKIP